MAIGLLTGCGDGSSGATGAMSGITPTPSPTPTPTPTPVIAVTTYQAASPLLYTSQAAIQNNPTPYSGIDLYGAGHTVSIGATGTYTVMEEHNPPPFVPSSSDPVTSSFRTLSTVVGSDSASLTILQQGPANPLVTLNDVDFAHYYLRHSPDIHVADNYDRYYVYGNQTASADLPRTGALAYKSYFDGIWADGILTTNNYYSRYPITQNSTLNIDATTGSATFSVDFSVPNSVANAPALTLHLAGVGTVNATGIIFGTLSGTSVAYRQDLFGVYNQPYTYNYVGNFSGAYFGAGGVEAGIAIRATGASNTNEEQVIGTMVGRRN